MDDDGGDVVEGPGGITGDGAEVGDDEDEEEDGGGVSAAAVGDENDRSDGGADGSADVGSETNGVGDILEEGDDNDGEDLV